MALHTQTTLLARVKLLVSDGGTNLYSDAAYNRFIDDAIFVTTVSAPFPESEILVNSVAGQVAYNAGATCLKILHVDYDDVGLIPTSMGELANMDEKWITRDALQPTHWYVNGKFDRGNPESADTATYQFGVWPIPTASTSSVIRVIAKTKPIVLAGAGSSPVLPSWGHEAVAYEAAAMVLESRGEHRNMELAVAYRSLRDFYIAEMRSRLSDRYQHATIYLGDEAPIISPRTLLRDREINATGRAGAGD